MKQLLLSEVASLCMKALTSPRILLNRSSAVSITKVIVAAERHGSQAHGLFRLPGYCAGVLHSKVDPTAEPTVTDVAPSVVVCDARHGYAPLAFERSTPLLGEKTKTNGCAVCSIQNSFHFAALWYEAEQLAIHHQLASIVCVNSKAFVAQPQGTGRRLYGTNPMAFGYPRPNQQHPLIIDQASSQMARGEIMMHDGALPNGVGVDRTGKPTNIVEEVLEGSQLPFGGVKGANVAMMVELMAAGMTGSPFAFQAHEEDPNWYGPTRHGEFIICMDPDFFPTEQMHGVESFFDRLVEDGGRIPGGRRHAIRKGEAEENATIEITSELYDEIVGIINGEDNKTQGYVT